MYYYYYPFVPQMYPGYEERSAQVQPNQLNSNERSLPFHEFTQSNITPPDSAHIGNQCAFVAAAPAHYNKSTIKHWPSQDAYIEHPGGFTHTSPV